MHEEAAYDPQRGDARAHSLEVSSCPKLLIPHNSCLCFGFCLESAGMDAVDRSLLGPELRSGDRKKARITASLQLTSGGARTVAWAGEHPEPAPARLGAGSRKGDSA